jgi:DNA-binding response OmpR family regulator
MLETQPRLLVIDSDRDAVRVLAAALHTRGIACGAVANPADAAAGVVRFGANLVLVAAELAGPSTAIDVVQALTRDPRTLHLPVVVVTRQAEGEALVDALRAGAADYLVGPLQLDRDLPALTALARVRSAPGAPFATPTAERMIQLMERLGLSGELAADLPDHCARFQHGKLVHARCEVLTGEGALEALLGLPEARFRPATPSSARPPSDPVEIELEVELEVVTEPPPVPEKLHCLLVDDEPDLLRLFTAFLVRAGFEVATAAEGVEGFEKTVALRPDVVVADLNMPHLDGWGLLRKIRSDLRVAETPVVFLSAQDDYRESLRAVNAGAQDYLAKATKMDLLAKRVRLALEPRLQARAQIRSGAGVQGRLEQLGVRWLLGELAHTRRSGTVALADGLGVFNVGLRDGAAVFIAAQQGTRRSVGMAALPLLVQLRAGDVQFLPDTDSPLVNLEAVPLVPLLERAASQAAVEEAAALEGMMVNAAAIEVDGQVFALYERFCPPVGREVAGYIRKGHTPKHILAQSALNPIEVVETVRDMVRRQVIKLRP